MLLDFQVVFAKISEELTSHHGSQSITACSGTLKEARKVGRADHTVVNLQRDALTLLLGQGSQMVAGADEAALFCAPECEAHAIAGFGRSLCQSQRYLEHCSRAATIVVNTRSLQHAVEMRTNDDQGTSATKSSVGQHVSRQPLAGHGVYVETYSGAGASCDIEGAAEFV